MKIESLRKLEEITTKLYEAMPSDYSVCVLTLIGEALQAVERHGLCAKCEAPRESEDNLFCLPCALRVKNEQIECQQARLQAMVAWAEADEAHRAFDCPHDAEHRCNCAASERSLFDRAERAREKAFALCDVKEITGVHNVACFDPTTIEGYEKP
jgi:hypothetical protein